jgi:division protein CdvB (Snf7/Vps24/ESCRT-III family)
MSTEERLARLENAFVILTRIVESIDERMDTHLAWINLLGEAQANSETKIAALTDAQIKTEEALVQITEAHTKLTEAHTRLAEAHTKLTESQSHTDQRLDALIDIVREWRNGKS